MPSARTPPPSIPGGFESRPIASTPMKTLTATRVSPLASAASTSERW